MKQSLLTEYGYLAIPRALLAYQNKMLYNSYLILEIQLSQINPELEPVMYKEINGLAQNMFDSWVALGYRENGGTLE